MQQCLVLFHQNQGFCCLPVRPRASVVSSAERKDLCWSVVAASIPDTLYTENACAGIQRVGRVRTRLQLLLYPVGTEEATSEAQQSALASELSTSGEEEEEDDVQGGADSLSEGWGYAVDNNKDECSSDESDEESDDESGPMSFTAADDQEDESEPDNVRPDRPD